MHIMMTVEDMHQTKTTYTTCVRRSCTDVQGVDVQTAVILGNRTGSSVEASPKASCSGSGRGHTGGHHACFASGCPSHAPGLVRHASFIYLASFGFGPPHEANKHLRLQEAMAMATAEDSTWDVTWLWVWQPINPNPHATPRP